MNYELAKQLKAARYPYGNKVPGADTIGIPNPSLEQLIEACRPQFFSLVDNVRSWRAQSPHAEINTEGATPKEAVAKLWLALNSSPARHGAGATADKTDA